MDNSNPLLTLQNVTIKKGPQVILREVNLTLNPGEYACIIGRSGTGKTSLLRTIALLEDPLEGRIIIMGREYTGASDPQGARVRLEHIGYIPQHDNLIPQLTVWENIILPLKLRQTPADEAEYLVMETARLLEIHMLLDRYPHQLSGGQRRRTIIARALVKKPKIILADEPLTGLDEALANKILNILKQHADNNLGVIHAAPTQVNSKLCSKTYRIRGGTLQEN